MVKPFDPSKFRKHLTKSNENISEGFKDPTDWISTGNYALNYLISGDFYKGVPLGKVTMLAGESGSAKSFIASGALVKSAQENGIFPILIDTEDSLDKTWLEKVGVDVSEDKIMRFPIFTINDAGQWLDAFISKYNEDYKDLDYDEKPKILIVVDSLGHIMSDTEMKHVREGEITKGVVGGNAKSYKLFIKSMIQKIHNNPIGIVITNHTYDSQDPFDPDPKISGGGSVIYSASLAIAMKKYKLKEDSEGKSTGADVTGIRSYVKVIKSRFTKPFEKVEIKIPYEAGMLPYSGLFDMFLKSNIIVKDGVKYTFTDPETGEVISYRRKEWEHTGKFDIIMEKLSGKDFNKVLSIPEDESSKENEDNDGE